MSVKIEPVDFSLSSSDSATWAGSATLVQNASGSGPRASYLGMLSLLAYELLGGPRNTVETTGRYTPLAVLSEEGNTLLRRGLTDQLASSAEMCHLLEGEILGKESEHPFASKVVAAPATTHSGRGTPPPPTYVPPVAAEPPTAPAAVVAPPPPTATGI